MLLGGFIELRGFCCCESGQNNRSFVSTRKDQDVPFRMNESQTIVVNLDARLGSIRELLMTRVARG